MQGAKTTHRSLPVVSNETSQSLCRNCALCCDGTLFDRVPLETAEIDAMRDIGVGVIQSEGKTYFAQPCVKLFESSCSIYAARPGNCRGYRCRVLRRLENGELSVEAANALGQKASELASTTHKLLSSIGDRSWSIWTRLEAFAKAENLQLESPEFSRRHSLLGMHAISLRKLLDVEFSVKKDAPAVVSDKPL